LSVLKRTEDGQTLLHVMVFIEVRLHYVVISETTWQAQLGRQRPICFSCRTTDFWLLFTIVF